MTSSEEQILMGVLDGKTAIVTGAGQGVGKGVALALASEGAQLVVTGRSEDKLIKVTEEIAGRGSVALPVVCDGKDGDQVRNVVDKTIDRFGTIDILVNNAQQTILGPMLELSEDDYEDSWLSGPFAALRFMRACHPYLAEGGGAIINLGSAASLDVTPGFSAYAAVKDAMRSLSRGAAVEWGKDGIRVNIVLPLAMTEAMVLWGEKDPEGYERVRSGIPLGRFGDSEADIGRAVVFLAGPDGRYITGISMLIDGGQAFLR
jgi:NAD(P)-dependent dehydrogenase (short-subunit alcohol dehydrogenase family)